MDVIGPSGGALQDSGGPGRRRVQALWMNSRGVVRTVLRDPENVPERLTLLAVDRLAEPSREWAARALAAHPESGRDAIAQTLRAGSAKTARIDGAIAGTPFLIALVPGYLGYLWQEATMVLRMAALYDRDPGDLSTAAELLVLRGLYPDIEHASEALLSVREQPIPDRPESRHTVRTWVRSIRMVLVFGGFLSGAKRDLSGFRAKLALVAMLVGVAALWVVTWIFPVTFMIAMAWTCERDARQIGRQALVHFGGPEALPPRTSGGERTIRTVLRSAALTASILAPIVFVAFAVHEQRHTRLNWIAAVGALVALSIVIAVSVAGRRRA
jgi:hypothetical protein